MATASVFFFFNDTATTEIYTLSLHDALPIFVKMGEVNFPPSREALSYTATTRATLDRIRQTVIDNLRVKVQNDVDSQDRKSTRLNSSHANISYAVFCLKKKNKLHE